MASSRTRPPGDGASWAFAEGDPIAPGRTVLRHLGGGNRYEVWLVWDDKLFAVTVAKVLRPDQVEDPVALRDLRKEAEALERLAHPVIVRGFDAVLDGPRPHVLIEHLEGPTLRSLLRRGGAGWSRPWGARRCARSRGGGGGPRCPSSCRWPSMSPRRCTTWRRSASCTSTSSPTTS